MDFILYLRTELDFVQLFLSIQFYNADSSSVVPLLWIWKSVVSTSTNVLGLLDNINDLIPLNLMTSFITANPWANLMSFHSVTLLLRSFVQLVGAVGSWMIFIQWQNSIPPSKLQITEFFLITYIIQKIIKAILFALRIAGSNNQLIEKIDIVIYGFSAILNLGQMHFSIIS